MSFELRASSSKISLLIWEQKLDADSSQLFSHHSALALAVTESSSNCPARCL